MIGCQIDLADIADRPVDEWRESSSMTDDLAAKFHGQKFGNEYALVDGVAMHQEFGAQFRIPASVLKRHLKVGFYVELRVDSPRFSMHEDDAARCECPSCQGELSKPILRHEVPQSLFPQQLARPPSRGWGEDFWVQVLETQGHFLAARVDNHLCESKLHGIELNSTLYFHEDHVLAIHGSHRLEMVGSMSVEDIKELAAWLSTEQIDPE